MARPARVDERMLTTKEAAELLNVSPKTVIRRIHAGILPAQRNGPRLYRIHPADLGKTQQRVPTSRAA